MQFLCFGIIQMWLVISQQQHPHLRLSPLASCLQLPSSAWHKMEESCAPFFSQNYRRHAYPMSHLSSRKEVNFRTLGGDTGLTRNAANAPWSVFVTRGDKLWPTELIKAKFLIISLFWPARCHGCRLMVSLCPGNAENFRRPLSDRASFWRL